MCKKNKGKCEHVELKPNSDVYDHTYEGVREGERVEK